MERLFTFGCSFSQFHWPTWADILGRSYPYHENWAQSGTGNKAISERVSECVLKNNIGPDDTVIVQWTDAHRFDAHDPQSTFPDSNWRYGGNIFVNPNRVDFIMRMWREESFLLHSLNCINLTYGLLKLTGCKFKFTNMITLEDDIKKFKGFEIYSQLFDKEEWVKPYLNDWYQTQPDFLPKQLIAQRPDQFLKIRKAQIETDSHPQPKHYARWLTEVLGVDNVDWDWANKAQDIVDKSKNYDDFPKFYADELDWHQEFVHGL